MSESLGCGGVGMPGMGLPRGGNNVGGSHGYAKRDMDKPIKRNRSEKAKERRRLRLMARLQYPEMSFKEFMRNRVSRGL